MNERAHKKQISELNALAGNILTDPEEIKIEIIDFYRSLMGTSTPVLPGISIRVMQNGPILIQQQKLELCAPVTTEEVNMSLQAIGDDKVPGIDRYNAVFV